MIKNDYYYIAMNDLLYLQSTLNYPGYNQISVQCEQITEKLLKSVATYTCTKEVESILKSHSLKKIYLAIKTEYKDLELNVRELAYLTDFYFDAKYPGDDFVTVDKESCLLCLNILYDTLEEVNRFRQNLQLESIEFERKLMEN